MELLNLPPKLRSHHDISTPQYHTMGLPQDNTTVEDIEQNDIEDSGSSEQEEPIATDVTMANPPMPPKPSIEIGPPMLLGTIETIEFSGRRRLDEFILRSAIDIREGDVLTSAGIRQAIVDIYETGYIENVRVEQHRHLPRQIHQKSSFTLPKNRPFLMSHFLEIKNSMTNPSKQFWTSPSMIYITQQPYRETYKRFETSILKKATIWWKSIL